MLLWTRNRSRGDLWSRAPIEPHGWAACPQHGVPPAALPGGSGSSLRRPPPPPPAGCLTSRRWWCIVPSPLPFTAKKLFSRCLQPFSSQCLDSRGYREKKKKGERERKKEQCAIGTALEMEKVLKACNIHQGWIHKCHILNKPSKRQWQRKGALLQESLSFSFAAVRNLFFASHSISHYSINEVTSHSYWLACQSPCLIP